MSINGLAIIIDITDNHGAVNRVGFRQIRFYDKGVHLGGITWQELATSEFNSFYHAENLFMIGYSRTGDAYDRSWIAADPINSNQRIVGNFFNGGGGYDFDEIRIVNFHDSGGSTNYGINNIKIYVRHDSNHSDTTFNAAIPNSTLIFDGAIPEHVASDVEDEQILTLINIPPPTWNVSYDSNGEDFGTVPAAEDHEEAATVTVSGNTGTLGKIGHFFAGWNDQADGLGTHYDVDQTFPMPTADIILYAEWVVATGDNMMKSIIIDVTDNWGDSSYVGIRQIDIYHQGQKQIIPEDASFNAYATSNEGWASNEQWAFVTETIKTGSISYNGWYGTSATNQRLIFVFEYPIPFDGIRVNNLHHSGGLTDFGAKNVKVYVSDDAISDTTYDAAIPNSTLIFDGVLNEHVASDVEDEQVLTLINVAAYYSVTYDANTADSGTPPVDAVSYEENDTVTVLGQSDLAKTDLNFAGWNTAADGTGTAYNESDTLLMGTADITLYAQWVAAVTYDGNGYDSGTPPVDSSSYYPGSNITVLGPSDLVKDLNDFVGWNTAADGTGTSYIENDTFAASINITLYAEWTPTPIYGDIFLKTDLPEISGLGSVPQIGFGRISPAVPTIKVTAGGYGKIAVDTPTISGVGVVKIMGHVSLSPGKPEVKASGYSAIIGTGKISPGVGKVSGVAVSPSSAAGQIIVGKPEVKGVGVVGVIGTGKVSPGPPRVHGFSELSKAYKVIKYDDDCPCS